MTTRFRCGTCSRWIRPPAGSEGRLIRCRGCDATSTVPSARASAPSGRGPIATVAIVLAVVSVLGMWAADLGLWAALQIFGVPVVFLVVSGFWPARAWRTFLWVLLHWGIVGGVSLVRWDHEGDALLGLVGGVGAGSAILSTLISLWRPRGLKRASGPTAKGDGVAVAQRRRLPWLSGRLAAVTMPLLVIPAALCLGATVAFVPVLLAFLLVAQGQRALALLALLLLPLSILVGYAMWAVPCGRIGLRYAPPALAGRRRLPLVAATVIGGLLAYPLVRLVVALIELRPSLSDITWPVAVACAVPLMALVAPAAVVFEFTRRHLWPQQLLERPFVLFLRRFSTFSDRVLFGAILRSVPAGCPVAVLTATRSRAGDWNPFVVAVAGIRFRRLLRSMPWFLRSRDDDWQSAARALVERADRIVIDVSDGSTAIENEIEMIEAADRWPDTVIVNHQSDEYAVPDALADRTEVLEYRRSWLRAIPGLVLGGVATIGMYLVVWLLMMLPGLLYLLFPVAGQIDFQGVVGQMGQVNPQAVPVPAAAGGVGQWAHLGIVVLGCVWLAVVLAMPIVAFWIFFFRPQVDASFQRRIRQFLRG